MAVRGIEEHCPAVDGRSQGWQTHDLGSQSELEGKLVEHTLSLCDQLEAELRQKLNANNGRRAITPRVKDMANLGIRWQHGHERGSGGKGGVGNSGRAVNGVKPGEHAGRTAGQVLILKRPRNWAPCYRMPLLEKVPQELRSLLGRQETRKLKDRREEGARQRVNQMQRKPYLQAKTEVPT
ncbi:TFIIB zinc-binding [Fragilaria crotonensis]|nr:TFIIB zinc-binding [Fragilaria crotonensis]